MSKEPKKQEPRMRATVATLKTTTITPDRITPKAEPTRQPPRDSGRRSATGFRGVSKSPPRSKNPYRARLGLGGGKTRFLGDFATLEEAARAHDVAALAEFGAAARLNFPGGKPAANGHAKNGRLPSVERLDFSDPQPKPTANESRSPSVRVELRAMGEVLEIVRDLGPEAARRVLAWVSARLGIEGEPRG
jgi:hypothetical protein